MSISWKVVKVDPTSKQMIEGEEAFDVGCLDMTEIDFLLVGKLEGPINGLMVDPGDGDSGEEDVEFDPDQELAMPFISPEGVRLCADRLSAIPPGKYISLKKFVKEWFSHVTRDEEMKEYYDDLVETTESLRKYIVDAAARGYALEVWFEGI